jgi:mannose-1-phosphate guanylyltransferase
MRAMLLCAGLGTRLWPLTADRPKAAVRLGGRSLAEHGLLWLERHGVTEATVNLHHQGDVLAALLGDRHGGVAVRYSRETELLGTGGALDAVRAWLGGAGTFVAANGKLVTEIDLSAALATHRQALERGALGTLVVRPNPDPARISTALTDETGSTLQGFIRPAEGDRTPLPPEAARRPLMYAGIALWEPALLDLLPPGASDVVSALWGPLVARQPGALAVHVDDALWLEPSTLDGYLDAAMALSGRQNLVEPGARLARSVRLTRSVIWRGATVGDNVQLDECVIGEDAVLPPGFRAHREVLVPRALVADLPHGPAGQHVHIDGELARVPLD